MGLRKTILATGEYYHILNRSIQGIPIFKGKRENILFLEAMEYYLQPSPPTRFSIYRVGIEKYQINLKKPLVSIINFCLMPNHFHFTLRQEKESGIRKFIQRLTNSFAHYFNIKYKNRGPLFEGNFKAVRIETDEQLIHLSRYIHLNPVSAYLVENPEDYPYSSYRVYLKREDSKIVDPSPILEQFSSSEKYQSFVQSQRDYQRELEKIKHLILE
ncbi:hypothetical protein COU95_01175 [Candidatus Shapirobacteria bacterium CG10_big_fil_rev_8_21_14_0_10_40_9]|uniref:Transposase IS200-like domain-containing protein n=1 Tax=Candidatus Shapirobacteria bacterium CG10_big_fil_rev_8_21_14_0_10_40_9 TaxID=1974888 RepID=A0A2M8L411_9BACT|nr:MAG: hypothetical protein COU95_01175 [Candidatus Shapirobacteria bacterium CG10_big_fil_rev_8_21_14_0_10_40_9]